METIQNTEMKRTALCLGGTGFISSFCVRALLQDGYSVTVMSRGKTKLPFALGDELMSRLSFVKGDRENSKEFRKLIRKLCVNHMWDAVIDFLAYEPSEVRDVIRALKRKDSDLFACGLYIMISTDSVYQVCTQTPSGDMTAAATRPWIESDGLNVLPWSDAKLEKRDDYGYDKYRCEQELRDAGLPFTALRLPDVLGEAEIPSSRHYAYQRRLMQGIPIFEPSQCGVCTPVPPLPLSFVYVGDVAHAVLFILKQPKDLVRREIFNVANTEVCSLRDYIGHIADILAEDSKQPKEQVQFVCRCTPRVQPTKKRRIKSPCSSSSSSGSDSSSDSDADDARCEYLPSVECGPVSVDKLRKLGWNPTSFDTWLRVMVKWYAEPGNRSKMKR